MKKFWEFNDAALFDNKKYSATGLITYWKSIDSAFRHWDTFVYGKPPKRKLVNVPTQKQRKPNFSFSKREHSHWKRNEFVKREIEEFKRRKLPTPLRK